MFPCTVQHRSAQSAASGQSDVIVLYASLQTDLITDPVHRSTTTAALTNRMRNAAIIAPTPAGLRAPNRKRGRGRPSSITLMLAAV